jgi:hypothetical protein
MSRFTDRRCGICWFLIHNGFGNMAYILFCGLPCLRRKGAQEKEGFHNTFEEKKQSGSYVKMTQKTTDEIRTLLSDAKLRF